jgi:demethylmenaquinone methyltransferase/2-methoxy-6-polyprenyl-1,4-benzoquinol methylase
MAMAEGTSRDGGDAIYDPAFVKGVFDRCSAAYRNWSNIASFGFIERWRRQCVGALPEQPSGARGFDLMAGTGEAWSHLFRVHPAIAGVVAVDLSEGMCRHAISRLHRGRESRIEVIEADVLAADLADGSADFVISTFGMKTFNRVQHRRFAETLARVLRPGGSFSLIEASDPKGWALRGVYMFYLCRVLPWVEKLFLHGAQDFAMLGVYCTKFGDCAGLLQDLRAAGLEAQMRRYFFGCATGVVGRRPD